MPKRYACAHAVLPHDLVEAIQAHFSGLLWVPRSKLFYVERRNLVLALKDEGVSPKEISRLAGISPRRVYQILQEAEGKGNIGDGFKPESVDKQPDNALAAGSEIRLNSDFPPESETSVQNSHDDD